MQKLLLPLLVILSFTACQKVITEDKSQEEIIIVATKDSGTQIKICHNGHTISINSNAWLAHQSHGDLPGDCSGVLTTTICNQTWMVRNLDVSTYANGDPIPQVTDPTAWANLTTGAWCYYSNDPANGSIYGKLYNWYAVNDPRRLAPVGWHVPSDAEWATLEDCLGGWQVAGGKMKATGTIEAGTGLWHNPNFGATNSSGFTGLPGGVRSGGIAIDFSSLNGGVYWWSSTEFSTDRAWTRQAFSDGSYLQSCHEQNPPQPCFTKNNGMSVRCVRD